jgi:hypothetical protein
MNRRDALSRVALLLGGTVIGGTAFLEGCKPADKKYGTTLKFTPEEIAYMDEIAETIIPATDTPGAKAAKVGAFMSVMVNDCYDEKDQKTFLKGLQQVNDESNKKFKTDFMESTPDQRKQLLNELDREQKAFASSKKKDDPHHYFRMMKELTLLGYFTSEVGATKALRYLPVPGRYDGNVPYKKGDRAWATN